MSFTYSDTDLSTDLAKVRKRIGDVDSGSALLTDEEIEDTLEEYPSVALAAIKCVQTILGRLARRTDRSAVGLSSSRSQAFQHYKDLLAELQSEASAEATPRLKGTSDAEAISLENDSDFRAHSFSVGMDDLP